MYANWYFALTLSGYWQAPIYNAGVAQVSGFGLGNAIGNSCVIWIFGCDAHVDGDLDIWCVWCGSFGYGQE